MIKNIYKALQVKILLNWTRMIILLYILNIFLYNPTLCIDVPETVSEWVRQNEEPETVAEFEAKYECDDIYRDPFYDSKNHMVSYSLHDTKDPAHHNVSSSLPISNTNGIITFEDAQHDTREVLLNSKQNNPVMLPSSLSMKPDLVHESVENVSYPERLTSATQATHDTQELQRDKVPLSLPTLADSLKQLPVDEASLNSPNSPNSPNLPHLPTAEQCIPALNVPMVNQSTPVLPVEVELWRTEEGLLATLSERYKDIKNPLEGSTTSQDSSQGFDINDPALNDPLSIRRNKFINDIIDKTAAILVSHYPNVNPDNMPDASIKEVTRSVMDKYGNKSEWLMKTRQDVENPHHEGNLRTQLIQNIITNDQGTLNVVQYKILYHMATSIVLTNANALNEQTPENFERLLNSELYDKTYQKFVKK